MTEEFDADALFQEVAAANAAADSGRKTGELFRYERQATQRAATAHAGLSQQLAAFKHTGQVPNTAWLSAQLGLTVQVSAKTLGVGQLLRNFAGTQIYRQLLTVLYEYSDNELGGVIFNCADWNRYVIAHNFDCESTGTQLLLTADKIQNPVRIELLTQFVEKVYQGIV